MQNNFQIDRQKKIEGLLLINDYLILQHAVLKYILKDTLMNAIIYDKFITNFVKRRYSQFALVALVRSGKKLGGKNLEEEARKIGGKNLF